MKTSITETNTSYLTATTTTHRPRQNALNTEEIWRWLLTPTLKFTLNLYNDYYKSGGEVSGMFLDGSKGVIMNSLSNVWYCVNVQGTCPATMPWRQGSPAPGGPNHTNCAGMLPWLLPGVADLPCQRGLTAMCTVSPTNFRNIRIIL